MDFSNCHEYFAGLSATGRLFRNYAAGKAHLITTGWGQRLVSRGSKVLSIMNLWIGGIICLPEIRQTKCFFLVYYEVVEVSSR